LGSASDRAEALVRAIDALLLEPHLEAETPTLYYPGEAKPVGPYATFGECVGAMRRAGHSEDSARRICGAMEAENNLGIISGLKRPDERDRRYLVRVLRGTRRAQRVFEGELARAFGRLGERVARAWRDLKQGDELTVELVIREAGLDDFAEGELARPYQRLYAMVGEIVYGAVSERVGVAIAWNIEDRVAREVVAAGGRRLGLVDLPDSTRLSLFAAIHDARSRGEGPIELARRIRQYVPAGRFYRLEADRAGSGVAYRSEMIARTETTYARNVSALGAGQEAGFERYLVFDARLGPTDETCELLDGLEVSANEAARLLDEEHPNGTRSVSPVPRT
jgi:hypothetical protein